MHCRRLRLLLRNCLHDNSGSGIIINWGPGQGRFFTVFLAVSPHRRQRFIVRGSKTDSSLIVESDLSHRRPSRDAAGRFDLNEMKIVFE